MTGMMPNLNLTVLIICLKIKRVIDYFNIDIDDLLASYMHKLGPGVLLGSEKIPLSNDCA